MVDFQHKSTPVPPAQELTDVQTTLLQSVSQLMLHVLDLASAIDNPMTRQALEALASGRTALANGIGSGLPEYKPAPGFEVRVAPIQEELDKGIAKHRRFRKALTELRSGIDEAAKLGATDEEIVAVLGRNGFKAATINNYKIYLREFSRNDASREGPVTSAVQQQTSGQELTPQVVARTPLQKNSELSPKSDATSARERGDQGPPIQPAVPPLIREALQQAGPSAQATVTDPIPVPQRTAPVARTSQPPASVDQRGSQRPFNGPGEPLPNKYAAESVAEEEDEGFTPGRHRAFGSRRPLPSVPWTGVDGQQRRGGHPAPTPQDPGSLEPSLPQSGADHPRKPVFSHPRGGPSDHGQTGGQAGEPRRDHGSSLEPSPPRGGPNTALRIDRDGLLPVHPLPGKNSSDDDDGPLVPSTPGRGGQS